MSRHRCTIEPAARGLRGGGAEREMRRAIGWSQRLTGMSTKTDLRRDSLTSVCTAFV